MNDDLLRGVAAELNQSPGAAGRVPAMSGLVTDINARIAAEATGGMPFDSSPYEYQAWLATMDSR